MDHLAEKKSGKQQKKKWWKAPLVWIPSVILILTCITLLIELPQKIYATYEFIFSEKNVTTLLRGRVINKLGNPIQSVVLKLDVSPNDSVITTSDGSFYFSEVPGKPGDRVRLYAFCKGFKSHNEYVTLPGPITIELNE